MTQSDTMVSPVGRFIGGSLSERRTNDYQGKPITDPAKHQFEIGVAFRKDDPAINPMLQAIATHAHAEFVQAPHIQAIIGQFSFGARGFSWKIRDGDAPNVKGEINKNSQGCWVVYFKSAFDIKCADQQNGEVAAASIKRGYFVQVAFSVAGNADFGENAGVYINPQVVKLIAFGEEIQGGIDAETAFAGHAVPTTLPPGASLTPVASTPMAGAPQMPAPGFPAAGAVPPPANPAVPQMPGMTPLPTASPTNPGVPPVPGFANGPTG